MKNLLIILLITSGFFLLAGGCSSEKPETTVKTTPTENTKTAEETKVAEMTTPSTEAAVEGEALFNKYCIQCHKNGGNIINPQKTLHRKDLNANNIKAPEDIVHVMRNPGKGMMKFSAEEIPDDNAKKIGEYILKTFK